MLNFYKKFERTIGGLKFAVAIITIFSLLMIIGTFLESWYGTDYANRVIYKSYLFMFIQFLMYLSILFATIIRLPIKKRLYGFYVIHTGLLLIGAGSFITYIAGIDGSLFLQPQTQSREVILNEDVIEIRDKKNKSKKVIELPYSASKTTLTIKEDNIHFLEYLPFAENTVKWDNQPINSNPNSYSSASYSIANQDLAEDFTLSLHPRSTDFKSSLNLGLLNITYLPKSMLRCFENDNKSGLIIWNSISNKCQTLEERGAELRKTSTGKQYFALKEIDRIYTFFPEFSPWPLDEDLNQIADSPIRILPKEIFKKEPNIFLFGKSIAYFDKNLNKWETTSFNSGKKIKLPWMNFEIFLNKYSESEYPRYIPSYIKPIQSNNNIIVGNTRAVKLQYKDKNYWITDTNKLILDSGIEIALTKKSITLPFELILTKFVMSKDPGTTNPASYESFISLFDNGKSSKHHVYMNNPLKYSGITFYQSSYSWNEEMDDYNSTFSVNVDPGRFIKYLGSLLLVLGSIWHFGVAKMRK